MSAAAHAAHHAHQTSKRPSGQMNPNVSVGSRKSGGSKDIFKERSDSDAGLSRPSDNAPIRSSKMSTEIVKANATKIFDNKWVIFTLDLIILVNMLQMGVCAGNDDVRLCPKLGCDIAEHSFVAIFLIEFTIKLWALRMSYFNSYWNWLDAPLAVTAVLDAWILAPIFMGMDSKVGDFIMTLLYLIRLFRLFRVLRTRPKLLIIFEGLTSSMKEITSVCMLLGMVIYTAAIFCVTLFSTVAIDSPLNFKSFPRALWTLFSLSIVADWTDIVSPVVEKYWWSPVFFLGFVFLATFGILNLIIGVITEKTIEVHDHHHQLAVYAEEAAKMEQIDKIAEMIFGEQDDGTITQEEMMEYVSGDMHGPTIKKMVEEADLPAGYDIWDCHAMFDRDVSGSITRAEFVQGMGRLIFSNQFQRSAMTQIAIADVLVQTKAVETNVIAEIDRLRADMGLSTIERRSQSEVEKDAKADLDPSAPGTEQVPVAVPKLSARLPSATTEVPQFDNLPSCKALVQRLQEPLTQLLADNLREVAVPKDWPAPTVSVVKAEGLTRTFEVTRGIRGKGQSASSSPKIEAGRGGQYPAIAAAVGDGQTAGRMLETNVGGKSCAGGIRGDVDNSIVNDIPGGGGDSQRIAGAAAELGLA